MADHPKTRDKFVRYSNISGIWKSRTMYLEVDFIVNIQILDAWTLETSDGLSFLCLVWTI
jgi:hypothetical protein